MLIRKICKEVKRLLMKHTLYSLNAVEQKTTQTGRARQILRERTLEHIIQYHTISATQRYNPFVSYLEMAIVASLRFRVKADRAKVKAKATSLSLSLLVWVDSLASTQSFASFSLSLQWVQKRLIQ